MPLEYLFELTCLGFVLLGFVSSEHSHRLVTLAWRAVNVTVRAACPTVCEQETGVIHTVFMSEAPRWCSGGFVEQSLLKNLTVGVVSGPKRI